jgi:hypothetical protein
MAEREGFEPSRRGLATYAISSRVPSASSDTSPLPYRFESPALRSTKILAEREGFEPSVRFYPYNRLAGGCLQPARPPLRFDAVYRNLHTLVVHSIITTVYLHRAPSARRSRGASASATLAILRPLAAVALAETGPSFAGILLSRSTRRFAELPTRAPWPGESRNGPKSVPIRCPQREILLIGASLSTFLCTRFPYLSCEPCAAEGGGGSRI